MKPVIFGIAGPALSPDERSLFADVAPAGYILFKRNCIDRAQMKALTGELRAVSGRADVPILIDQEGGRVARMQPPEWPAFPTGEAFDRLYEIAPISALEAARSNGRALALMLAEVGVTVNAYPLLDVRTDATHPAIGDRALGHDPLRVASIGRALLEGMRSAGVAGIVKHMPGQGRATVDSHKDLPVVDADDATLEADLRAFALLGDAPMGMTGHIMFPAWDADRCVTLSPTIIDNVIRGRIGFDGLLMSDDLDMDALKGDVPTRAADCVAAGCDIALNCWGRFDEMAAIAAALPEITDAARERLDRAVVWAKPVAGMELAEAMAKRDALLALV